MKINKKAQNITLAIIASIALIGFILGTFLDQKITGKMGDFDNFIGILFTGIGHIPSLLVGVFAGCTLFFIPKLKSKSWNIILRVVGALAVIICIFFQIEEGVKYVNYPKMEAEAATWKALLISFIGLANLAIILFSRIWIKKMDQNAILPACIAILSIIVFYVLSCEVLKYLASRPRPRVVYQGVIEFKQWYQWQPLNALHSEFKDCKSFVSGHTSNAACLVTLLPICASLSRKENSLKIQIMCSIIGALFVFVVAFARIIGMAHYMSDVMGGILLSIAMQAVVINVAPTIIKKFK